MTSLVHAQGEAVALHRPYLYRYALSKLRRAEIAEEVVQDTLMAALAGQATFREVLDSCLAALPAATAQAFYLREVEGLSTEEICEQLGISESNCWVMLHRARISLRRSREERWFLKEERRITGTGTQPQQTQSRIAARSSSTACSTPPPRAGSSSMPPPALLLARIYEVFPLRCSRCGGAMRIIAFITAAPTVRDLLGHLGAPTAPPRIAPARGPPLWEGADPEHDPAADPLLQCAPAFAFDQRRSGEPPP